MVDFNSVRLKPRKYLPVTVTDPNIVDDDGKMAPIAFQLRRLLNPEEDRARILADDYYARYVTGGFRDALEQLVKEPLLYMPFVDLCKPDESGVTPEVPELSWGLLMRCARLQEMQPPTGRYNMDQLLVMSVVAPDGFDELVSKGIIIHSGGGEPNQGNALTGNSEKQETS